MMPKPFKDSLQEAHVGLLGHLRDLEKHTETGELTLEELLQTQKELREHFAFEESGGYMSSVIQAAPRFETSAQRLGEQHKSLDASLDDLIQLAKSEGLSSQTFRDSVVRWIRELRVHEAAENEMMYEAFSRDLGAKD